MMKFRKHRIVILVIVLVLLAGGAWFVMTGGMPLVDGAKLANGRITIAVDDFFAAYVVEADDGSIFLVDATMDTEALAIQRTLAALGKSADDVGGIFITHGHGDHIGGAKAFPRARVFALDKDADLVEGRRTAQNLLGRSRDPEPTGIEVTDILRDGQQVEFGGTTIQVFAIPGHTLGSAAYLVHGVLFLGDSAAATSAGTLGGAPPVFSADREQAHASLADLARRLNSTPGLQVDALAFGHQGPLTGIDPLLEWAGID